MLTDYVLKSPVFTVVYNGNNSPCIILQTGNKCNEAWFVCYFFLWLTTDTEMTYIVKQQNQRQKKKKDESVL